MNPKIPDGWSRVEEGRRVALGDRVWNGRRYVDLTAILGCEKVGHGQTMIRNTQMHRALMGGLDASPNNRDEPTPVSGGKTQ